MMCPGISYSTVHSLIFHTNGSVQDNKLFQEFCNKKQAHFAYNHLLYFMIDHETLTLLDQQDQYYDDLLSHRSAITGMYEVITTFMKIHNISATWDLPTWNTWSFRQQLVVGPFECMEGGGLECCPPM